MQITDKFLSLPPYLSTSWKNISSLQLENRSDVPVLVIELKNHRLIEIPSLSKEIIDQVFTMHAQTMDQNQNGAQKTTTFSLMIPNTIGEALSILQHSPEHSQIPQLPFELLHKLISLAQTLVPEYFTVFTKGEPHCNCPHCQIMRAAAQMGKEEAEEIVPDADLQFKTWDVKSETENLYTVTNPLDTKEYYSVFLGKPIGCTCGNQGCEHIQAVLRS